MKKNPLLWMVVSLVIAGCVYDAPYPADNKLPIHKEWLGTWEFGTEFENAKVYVTANSDTEYLLTFPIEGDEFHTLARHIKIGNIDAVQLTFLGTEEAPLTRNQFNIVTAEKHGRKMTVSFINEFVIEPSIKSSLEFKNTILENIHNDALFHNPSLILTKTD